MCLSLDWLIVNLLVVSRQKMYVQLMKLWLVLYKISSKVYLSRLADMELGSLIALWTTRFIRSGSECGGGSLLPRTCLRTRRPGIGGSWIQGTAKCCLSSLVGGGLSVRPPDSSLLTSVMNPLEQLVSNWLRACMCWLCCVRMYSSSILVWLSHCFMALGWGAMAPQPSPIPTPIYESIATYHEVELLATCLWDANYIVKSTY